MSQFHEIGVPFSFDGTTLVTRELATGGCESCYCRGEERDELCKQLQCSAGIRRDGKHVVFDEIFPQ